jgi:hypothetical protein
LAFLQLTFFSSSWSSPSSSSSMSLLPNSSSSPSSSSSLSSDDTYLNECWTWTPNQTWTCIVHSFWHCLSCLCFLSVFKIVCVCVCVCVCFELFFLVLKLHSIHSIPCIYPSRFSYWQFSVPVSD